MTKTIVHQGISLWQSVWSFLKRLGTRRKWVTVVAALIIIGIVGFAVFGPESSSEDPVDTTEIRNVQLVPVSSFAEGATGSTIAAGSETVVRAETSGKITEVLPVGTRVGNGTTIAVFENAAQRAALLQAEGSLEAAEASLEKTQDGPRSERIAVLEAAVTSAENTSVATLLSAYGTVDSAVRDTADQMFSNPEGTAPTLIFSSSNSSRRNQIQSDRVALSNILDRQSLIAETISSNSDLVAEFTKTESEVREIRSFMDDLITALNEAVSTGSVTNADIAAFKAAATAARTALNASLSSIASARGSLETAETNLEEGLAGAEDTDLAAAAAAVKQAQGAYNSALAAYRKTIVSAPTGGTILSCNAAQGDVLTVGSDICRIQTAPFSTSDTFVLPLSSVKYTPAGAFVFVVNGDGALEGIQVETGLVAANGISVTGLLGDEFIVSDVRGLKAGEVVNLQ